MPRCLRRGSFTENDARIDQNTIIKRALAVILYSLGKSSLGFIAKLFGVHKTTVLKWIKREGNFLKEPEFSSEIDEIEIDEMWHFIKKNKRRSGYLKPLTEIPNELLLGSQVVGLAKQLANYTKN